MGHTHFKAHMHVNFKAHVHANFKAHVHANFKAHLHANFKAHVHANSKAHMHVNFKAHVHANFKAHVHVNFKAHTKSLRHSIKGTLYVSKTHRTHAPTRDQTYLRCNGVKSLSYSATAESSIAGGDSVEALEVCFVNCWGRQLLFCCFVDWCSLFHRLEVSV